ncbi:hypothetical protein GCM10007160_42160 [Litchfieldella qijiaojingensis]|uniref:Uncharacterized protein n=2 Tax=Litchfieldella qijiaojingensis TaxID=980347 RepID=A0ABQ2ZAR8_9GAMM|nr:hypothetical protein GCM10007160_42160 [Halomonas qijiaojingensis]
MFSELINKFKERKAINEWRSSPLGIALENHSREYFYGENELLGGFSEEGKQNIIGDFYQKIIALSTDENAFLTYREQLATYVCEYASFQVLCLKEDEKKDSFYSDCPYISAELYKHTQILSEHNDLLKEHKWKNGEVSDEEFIALCNARCAVLLYCINGLNIVRIEFKDVIEEKDWLRPFIKSMLIWEEDTYRQKISLPSLLPNDLDGLWHSTFMNIVVNGAANPYYEWEKAQEENDDDIV